MAKPTHVQNTSKNPRNMFGALVAPRQFIALPAKVNPRDMRRLEALEATGAIKLSDKGEAVVLKGVDKNDNPIEVKLPVLVGKDETRTKSKGVDRDSPPPPPPTVK